MVLVLPPHTTNIQLIALDRDVRHVANVNFDFDDTEISNSVYRWGGGGYIYFCRFCFCLSLLVLFDSLWCVTFDTIVIAFAIENLYSTKKF